MFSISRMHIKPVIKHVDWDRASERVNNNAIFDDKMIKEVASACNAFRSSLRRRRKILKNSSWENPLKKKSCNNAIKIIFEKYSTIWKKKTRSGQVCPLFHEWVMCLTTNFSYMMKIFLRGFTTFTWVSAGKFEFSSVEPLSTPPPRLRAHRSFNVEFNDIQHYFFHIKFHADESIHTTHMSNEK